MACAVSSKSKPGRSIIINTKEIKENKHITNQIKETKIGKKEHKRSLKFRDNIRKQLIETLTALENPRSAEQLSTSSLSPCAFSLKSISLEDGFCTYYGACRFRGQDYMYQVGFYLQELICCACIQYGLLHKVGLAGLGIVPELTGMPLQLL